MGGANTVSGAMAEETTTAEAGLMPIVEERTTPRVDEVKTGGTTAIRAMLTVAEDAPTQASGNSIEAAVRIKAAATIEAVADKVTLTVETDTPNR